MVGYAKVRYEVLFQHLCLISFIICCHNYNIYIKIEFAYKTGDIVLQYIDRLRTISQIA